MLTKHEAALVERVRSAAPRYSTAEQYESFIRGFMRVGDSKALEAELAGLANERRAREWLL